MAIDKPVTKMQKIPLPASSIEYVRGIGKDSGKPYRGLILTVGEWSQMHFLESRFEMDYIEKLALSKNPEKVHDDTTQTDSKPENEIDLQDENDSQDWLKNL